MKLHFIFYSVLGCLAPSLHASLDDKGPSYDAWLPQAKEHFNNKRFAVNHIENGKELLGRHFKHNSDTPDNQKLKNLQKKYAQITTKAHVITFDDGVALAGSFMIARFLVRLFTQLYGITDSVEGITFLCLFFGFCAYLRQVRDYETKINNVASIYSHGITAITKKHLANENKTY